MSTHVRLFMVFGALNAAMSVILSALAAHLPALHGKSSAMFEAALGQQQFHALGLLAVGLCLTRWPDARLIKLSGWLMCLGIVLFSLNIHALGMFDFAALRGLVPWGGSALILSWLVLAAGVVVVRPPKHH